MVKQKTARLNIDVVGISELKWMGMEEFNSDDHYINYCGQESLRRNGVALIFNNNKNLKCSTWVQFQTDRMTGSFSRQTIQQQQSKSRSQPLLSRSWSGLVLWRPARPRTNINKRRAFIIGYWNAKGSQEILGVTGNFHLGVKNEAGQRITEFCQKNTTGIDNILFQQPKRWFYTCTSPNGQYQNQIDYILCSWIWRSSIQFFVPAKTRPGADCGSDYQPLISKSRLKLKKVGKTTRPFRYDLNQILYEYTMEVTDSFEGLDLVNRVSEELWTEICNNVQEVVTKQSQRKRNARRQNDCLIRL